MPTLCSYTSFNHTHDELDFAGADAERNVVTSPPGWSRDELCRWCRARMAIVVCKDWEVYVCERCGYWLFEASTGIVHHLRGFVRACGAAKAFDIGSLEIPLGDLRNYLQRKPDDVAHVHPTKFELLMGDCLKAYFPGSQVTHVGGTGDRGIDLLLVNLTKEVFLVQVKRRGAGSGSEGPRVVRELNGVLFREGLAKGMVITTAPHFTNAARLEAVVATKTIVPYEMVLVSHPEVVQMLRLPSPTPYEPWREAVVSLQSAFGTKV